MYLLDYINFFYEKKKERKESFIMNFKHLSCIGVSILLTVLWIHTVQAGSYNIQTSSFTNKGWISPTGNSTLTTSTNYDYHSQTYASNHNAEHCGVDVVESKNSNIYAIASGKVIRATRNYSATKNESVVIVMHRTGDGEVLYVIYGHVFPNVSVNDYVRQGENIGKVKVYGSPTHIHFGINTTTGNPSKWGAISRGTNPDNLGFTDPFIYLSNHQYSYDSRLSNPSSEMQYLKNNNIMNNQDPNAEITRWETWTMIFRATEHALERSLSSSERKSISNQQDGDKMVDRQECLTMIVRALNVAGLDYSTGSNPFNDADQSSFKNYILKAYSAGIIDSNWTRIYPFNIVPRHRFAQWAFRMINLMKGGGGNNDDPCPSGQIQDCENECVSESTARSWLGDGYCDDGYYGMDLYCSKFNYDGGDCD